MTSPNRQSAETDWYAIRTAPQSEFYAERILTQRGFEVFLPVELKLRRKTRYCKTRQPKAFPLLVRYLFVQMDREFLRWGDLFKVPGVQSVVGFNNTPHPISQDEIDVLEQQSSNMHYANPHKYLHTRNEFKAGDSVLVVEGPFAGRLVDVEQITGRKAKIWLKLFGTPQNVEIDVDDLELV